MSRLLEFLCDHQTAMLCDLEQLVKSESPSHDKYLVDQCGEVLQQLFMQRVNSQAQVIHQETCGDHLR